MGVSFLQSKKKQRDKLFQKKEVELETLEIETRAENLPVSLYKNRN
jgi:hypothetical protein